jgi:hypothetical protein
MSIVILLMSSLLSFWFHVKEAVQGKETKVDLKRMSLSENKKDDRDMMSNSLSYIFHFS